MSECSSDSVAVYRWDGSNIRPLVLYPDPRLKQVLPAVRPGSDVGGVARDLMATLLHRKGLGLAANQIGHMERVIAVHVPIAHATTAELGSLGFTDVPIVMVNPEVTQIRGRPLVMTEACLSDPGYQRVVKRHESITVRFLQPDGVARVGRFSGLLARAVQHEIDHLDGVNLRDWTPLRLRAVVCGRVVKA